MMRSYLIARLSVVVAALFAPSVAAAANYEQLLAGANAMRWESNAAWKVNMALGLGIAPAFEYAEGGELEVLPLIDVEWRQRYFFSTQRGLGFNWTNRTATQAGPRLTMDWGRKASADRVLAGTQDIDPAIEIGWFWLNYSGPWRFNADIKQAVSGHKGVRGAFGAAHGGPIAPNANAIVGVEAHYASDRYNGAYFNKAARGVNDVTPYLIVVRNLGGGAYVAADARVSFALSLTKETSIVADRSYSAGAMFGRRF